MGGVQDFLVDFAVDTSKSTEKLCEAPPRVFDAVLRPTMILSRMVFGRCARRILCIPYFLLDRLDLCVTLAATNVVTTETGVPNREKTEYGTTSRQIHCILPGKHEAARQIWLGIGSSEGCRGRLPEWRTL